MGCEIKQSGALLAQGKKILGLPFRVEGDLLILGVQIRANIL
jgi:hypothetical protein